MGQTTTNSSIVEQNRQASKKNYGEYACWGNVSQITHANHMTMTTSRQILLWLDYSKTKEYVNITLLDLCLFTF